MAKRKRKRRRRTRRSEVISRKRQMEQSRTRTGYQKLQTAEEQRAKTNSMRIPTIRPHRLSGTQRQ
jgi:hypothetical protein